MSALTGFSLLFDERSRILFCVPGPVSDFTQIIPVLRGLLHGAFRVDLLVLVRVGSEEHVGEEERHYAGDSRPDREAAAREECAELVDAEAYEVGEDVLEEYREPEPLSVLHLLRHRRNRREAGRVEHVEEQEAEGRERAREPCRHRFRDCYGVFDVAGYVGEHAHR